MGMAAPSRSSATPPPACGIFSHEQRVFRLRTADVALRGRSQCRSDYLMRSFSFVRGALVAVLAGGVLTGCQDRLPTVTGDGLFPGGSRPLTVELLLTPEQFVVSDTVFPGFVAPGGPGFLVVANRFEGVLDAHGLARLEGFPDSVTFSDDGTSRTDDEFTYAAGNVLTVVAPNASIQTTTTLRLWELDQAWDTAGVSWTVADGRGSPVQWQTPGGTRGTLLSEATWAPGDTIGRDSISFAVDAAAVARMAAEGFSGLLVTSETPGSRVQLSRLTLRAGVRPASRPDTVIEVTVGAGPQRFVYNPSSPRSPTRCWWAGPPASGRCWG
jgi:hypothetical protein